MSTSTNDRINRFLKKQETLVESEADEAQHARDEKKRREARVAQVQAKWAEDTDVINGILKDFADKMAPLSPQFYFMDLGAPPHGMAAQSRITGHLGVNAVAINLSVDTDGILHGSQWQETLGSNLSTHTLAVLTADKTQYENFILALLGVD